MQNPAILVAQRIVWAEADRHIVVGDRRVEVADVVEHPAPVAIRFRELRIDRQRHVVVVHRRCRVALAQKDVAPVEIGPKRLRIGHNRRRIVGDGGVQKTFAEIGQPAIIVGQRELRIDADRLVIVGNRWVRQAAHVVNPAAIVVGHRKLRVQPDRLVVAIERRIHLPRHLISISACEHFLSVELARRRRRLGDDFRHLLLDGGLFAGGNRFDLPGREFVQEARAQPLHRRFKIVVRNSHTVEARQLRQLARQIRLGVLEAEVGQQQRHNVALLVDGELDFAPHHVVRLVGALDRPRREDHQKMRPRLDLVEDDLLKMPAVDALDIHEHVVAVIAQIEEDRAGDKRGSAASVADENGFVFGLHHSDSGGRRMPPSYP